MALILLVEDNETNRDLMTRRLQRRSYSVIFAVDGHEAIEKAKTEKPDIILMDMSLPVMDGWEATRRIREDENTNHIPIIGLSAHAMAGDRQQAIQAGCDEYATKPVDFERLIEIITTYLDNSKKS
jgi:CheY-like chemotaxis protein